MVVRSGSANHAQDHRRRHQREGRLLSSSAAPRVALTTDWLTSFGGGERVIQELLRIFPGAPIFTSVYDPARVPEHVRAWDVRPSPLQHLPGVQRYSRALLPLMPWAFAQFDLRDFDVVLSVSTAFSKNVRVRPGAVNLCYCNTPPRYLWDLWDEYRRRVPASRLLTPVLNWLRRQDLAAAQRVDRFMSNSANIAERVQRTYGRESEVVYPPVELDRISINLASAASADSYVVVSRLVGYKRIDLAVQACTSLGRKLLVVGEGPERGRLEQLAGPTVTFAGALPDPAVVEILQSARAFLFPGLEDFGIAPVEAQAAGRPVIAFGQGGALETVVDGVTGLFFHAQTASALADAIIAFEAREFDPAACRRNAERFDASVFRERIRTVVASAISPG